jgi:protein-S-isoprenylcysteine O-methyltransferase Ste14
MGIALIGEGIVFPNLTVMMLVMVALLFAIVTLFVMGYEEPTLRRMFGADYDTYTRSVHRWIPRLRPFDNPKTLP